MEINLTGSQGDMKSIGEGRKNGRNDVNTIFVYKMLKIILKEAL